MGFPTARGSNRPPHHVKLGVLAPNFAQHGILNVDRLLTILISGIDLRY